MKTTRYDHRRSLVHLCDATKRVALVCVVTFSLRWDRASARRRSADRMIVEYVPPQDPAHQSGYDWLVSTTSREAEGIVQPFRLPTRSVLRLQGVTAR